jgi:hypothetical protein
LNLCYYQSEYKLTNCTHALEQSKRRGRAPKRRGRDPKRWVGFLKGGEGFPKEGRVPKRGEGVKKRVEW